MAEGQSPAGGALACPQRLERRILTLGHRQQVAELPRRRLDRERVGELHRRDVGRRRDADLLEQSQLLELQPRLRPQQGDLGLSPGYLRLADIDQRCATDVVPRLRELEELLVAVELLAGHVGVAAGLEHAQVLLRHAGDQIRLGARYVRVGGAQLGVLQRNLRDRLSVQRPVEEQAVVRDRKSTRLNSSHSQISYAVFCLKKKNTEY